MALSQDLIAFVASVTLLGSSAALAHGEDKPGPHGGFVRMPGTFHTEVVLVGDGTEIDVYLLDTSNENATIQLSTASLKIENKSGTSSVNCKESDDHFKCKLPAGLGLTEGDLVVTAKRLGAPGSPANYQLPLGYGHANQ